MSAPYSEPRTMEIEVVPGAILPQPGSTIECHSQMSGLTYEVRVTSIRGLRWLDDGALLVTVRCTRRVVHDSQGG